MIRIANDGYGAWTSPGGPGQMGWCCTRIGCHGGATRRRRIETGLAIEGLHAAGQFLPKLGHVAVCARRNDPAVREFEDPILAETFQVDGGQRDG